MDIEVCENCKRIIGLLEQAFACNGHIVCQECNQLLRKSSSSLQKKVTEHPDSFDDGSEVGKQPSQISVTEEDFLVARSKDSNVIESQTTRGSEGADPLSAKPVSESNFLGQEPLRITPEDFESVSVQEESTFTVGPEDFREPPISKLQPTQEQVKYSGVKSLQLKESDFISEPTPESFDREAVKPAGTKSVQVTEGDFIGGQVTKSLAKKAVTAAGLSLKAKVLIFIIVAAAGGGAFIAYEGGLGQAKVTVDYALTKLFFSANTASPEAVCKMYLLACWKQDNDTAMSLLTSEAKQVMSQAEQQNDRWRREQLENLRGQKISDKEWQDFKGELAKASPQLVAMFEGTRFDFEFGGTSINGEEATVDMRARFEIKGPFLDGIRQMLQTMEKNNSSSQQTAQGIDRFYNEFGSRWWNYKFHLRREDSNWKIDDIEMPIGDIMEFIQGLMERSEAGAGHSEAKKSTPTPVESLTATRPSGLPSLPTVTQSELDFYRKSFVDKLAEAHADQSTQNSVRVTGVYIRPGKYTDPSILRTLPRLVFYSWQGVVERKTSEKTPIGVIEFFWATYEKEWFTDSQIIRIAETRQLIVPDQEWNNYRQIYP